MKYTESQIEEVMDSFGFHLYMKSNTGAANPSYSFSSEPIGSLSSRAYTVTVDSTGRYSFEFLRVDSLCKLTLGPGSGIMNPEHAKNFERQRAMFETDVAKLAPENLG